MLEGEGEVSFGGAEEEGLMEGASTMARIESKSSERVLFWGDCQREQLKCVSQAGWQIP